MNNYKSTILTMTVCFMVFGLMGLFTGYHNRTQEYGPKKYSLDERFTPAKISEKGNVVAAIPPEDKHEDDVFYDISADLATIKSENVYDIHCAKIKFSPEFPICLHDSGDFLTRIYSRGRVWESHILLLVKNILNSDPEMGLIDVGANLGYYSLLAGTLGHKAVAVEPLDINVVRFHKAAKSTGIDKYITLIQAGVSNKREESLICVKRTNVGGSTVKHDCKNPKDQFKLKTVLMDDLLKYTTFAKAVMKIDIEGREGYAMQETSDLFKKLDICYIFMETDFVSRYFCQKDDDPRYVQFNKIVKDLQLRNYAAYTLGKQHTLINTTNCRAWPIDTLWMRSDCRFPWEL